MTRLYASLVALIMSGVGLSTHATDADSCTARLTPGPVPRVSRPVTEKDLIELRDIGPNWINGQGFPILSLSPDKSKVAYQLIRANVDSNNYCFGIVVQDLTAGGKATLVDTGGDYIMPNAPTWGFAEDPQPSGVPTIVRPQWSPNGRSLAFLKKVGGVVQVWRVSDGAAAVQMTHADADIDSFAWLPDGQGIVFRSQPDLDTAKRRIEEEGWSGYLYDERFMPTVAARPLPRDPIPYRYETVDLNGQIQAADSAARALIDKPVPLLTVPSPANAGIVASLETANDHTRALRVRRDGKTAAQCTREPCQGLEGLWWRGDGRTLYFLHREGVRAGLTALYAWRPGTAEPRRILVTPDALISCDFANGELICLREGATRPRRLVAINMQTGADQTLYDPNPEFSALHVGSVTRLTWKNDLGLESYGDLVLPPDHTPGQRHPLVVVQYHSRGFLRGGTGDDYPVQVLAAHGMAVLNFEMPVPLAYSKGERDWRIINRVGATDWTDRKSILSALETGISRSIDTGAIDPDRIGLTGLSDGASTIAFALVNSRLRFQAVAMSNCCISRTGLTLIGPAGQAYFVDGNYPTPWGPVAAWKPGSIALNADRITTPILFQVPDNEYVEALEDYDALKAMGRPAELYVFPNERHIKWQPGHRAASYTRSVDWFDFWLQGREDPSPDKKAQYARWAKLRETTDAGVH